MKVCARLSRSKAAKPLASLERSGSVRAQAVRSRESRDTVVQGAAQFELNWQAVSTGDEEVRQAQVVELAHLQSQERISRKPSSPHRIRTAHSTRQPQHHHHTSRRSKVYNRGMTTGRRSSSRSPRRPFPSSPSPPSTTLSAALATLLTHEATAQRRDTRLEATPAIVLLLLLLGWRVARLLGRRVAVLHLLGWRAIAAAAGGTGLSVWVS